jgi:hypothetical protein
MSISQPALGTRSDDPTGFSAQSATFERLLARINEEDRAAERVMSSSVTGPRKQQITVAAAQAKSVELLNRIDFEEARNSLRHRIVSKPVKLLTMGGLVVIDFPVMLYLSGSVFNVDWSDPLGVPLLISGVVSLLGTAGAAWTLHHMGHNRRENKTHRRHLDWSTTSWGARAGMVGVGVLITLIAAGMFFRVYSDAAQSGQSSLAVLLAALASFVMLMSSAMVFGTAFRDGSPEQDDLAHYSAQVHQALQRKHEHEDEAHRLQAELDQLIARTRPSVPLIPLARSWTRPITVRGEVEKVNGDNSKVERPAQ